MPALHGRATESGVVTAALEAVARGSGGVVLITGPRGSGRSALLAEAVAAAPGHGVTVVHGLLPTDDGDADGADGADSAPGGAPKETEPLPLVLETTERLARQAAAGPLAVVVDDLQDLDEGALRALRLLPRRLTGVPVLWLLAAYARPADPEARAAVAALGESGRHLTLGPLPGDAMLALLRDLVGARPERPVAALADRCGGDPGLLVALVRAAEADGLLVVAPGGARLTGSALPRHLDQAVAARLGALSAPARAVLTAAATLPPRFRVDELARVLGHPPSSLWSPVAELTAVGLLVDHDGPLGFGQAVLREVLARPAHPARSAVVTPVPETTRGHYRRFEWDATLTQLDAQLAGDTDRAQWLVAAHRALFFSFAGWAEAALDDLATGLGDARDRGLTDAVRAWQKVRIRLLWDAGRLTEARREPVPELYDPDDVLNLVMMDAVARLALRLGDRGGYRRVVARATGARAAGHRAFATAAPWLQALGSDDVGEAFRLGAGTGLFERLELPPGVPLDPADQPRFVRFALAAGGRPEALRAVELAEERARLSPRFTLLKAAASHARGLLEEDPGQLLGAAELYRETSRRLDLAAAWEDAVRFGADPARLAAAAEVLEHAGVPASVPAGDREPLTPGEYRVVQLVVAGASNREAAAQLYLSPNTVGAHLRRVFTKLGVHSRVELLQLAAEEGIPAPIAPR